jgi:hypothetical protein
MRIAKVDAQPDWTLVVTTTDGRVGQFDMRPYLDCEPFEELKDTAEFMKISNGGYFVEWPCGADLSADTIEAKMLESIGGLLTRNHPTPTYFFAACIFSNASLFFFARSAFSASSFSLRKQRAS